MPEKPIKPGTNLLDQSSNMVASDRARRISSLHRTVDDLVQEQNKKRLQTSNEVNALTKQQKEMMMQLELERTEFTSETAKGYNSVLKGLGRTINSLATGVKSITIDTGKATSQAIGQYGKAISEDISINKTNTIAMALSRATPLFGYFAAKFMETDVFQGAAARIKDKVGSAMTEGLSKAGSGIANIFKKGKKVVDDEREKKPATVNDLEKLQKTIEGAPPKLQEGGYVKQGGIIEVHAAEVVTPIDKLLKQIDAAKNADISRKLDKTLTIMSQNLLRLETVVVEREESQESIVQTFIKEFQAVRDTKQASHQKRLLKAILELKVGLIGMTSRMRIAWQRTLLQHPTFRNMLMFSDIMKTAIISPIQFLFGIRGGYAGDVRGATRTHNVFLKTSNIMALLYTTLMPKIDDLVIYTKAAAEVLVGEEISGAKQVTYTMFDKIKEALTGEKEKKSLSEKMFELMTEKLNLDKEALGRAGITGLGGFARPDKIMKKAGVGKIKEEVTRIGRFAGEQFKRGKEGAVGAARWTGEKLERGKDVILSEIQKIRKMKEDQEEREEGIQSPSMAENISKTAELNEKKLKEERNSTEKFQDIGKKGNKFAKEHLGETKGVRRRLKKLGRRTWDMILLAFGFLKNMVGGFVGKFMGFLSPILAYLGLKKFGKIGKIAGKGISKAGKVLGFGKKATGMAIKTGAVGLTGAAVKKGATKKGIGKLVGKAGKVLGFGKKAVISPITGLAIKKGAVGLTGAVVKKGASKGIGKLVGKAGLKSIIKKVPILGLLAGIGFAAHRIMKGDIIGAGLEVASGAVSLVPGLGTAASIAIDAGIIGRDIVKGKTKESKTIEDKMTAAVKLAQKNPGIPNGVTTYKKNKVKVIDSKNKAAIQKYMDTETKKYGLNAEARKKGYDNLSRQLGSKIQEGSRQTTAAIINNSNVIASTSNQSVNSQGGPPASNQFGSGNNFAQDVVMCNIK